MALWGGRFEGSGPDATFKAFNDSLPFDRRLLVQDIEGSIGWARALTRAGVLAEAERSSLEETLRTILVEVQARPELLEKATDEDVHSFVERMLVERIGALGKKLHTGRSRNDQVATDLRLWTRQRLADLGQALRAARRSLASLAQREAATVFPGYTHLQRAQPVTLGHWALAYFEMLGRDEERFGSAMKRANLCPLGSGALAGTAYPIDRHALAKDLGFDAPTANSLDAVSDRDFVLDTLTASAACAIHLSRLAEDLIIYSSGEFALVELGEDVTTGSSLMPQKKNPDAMELIRGKAGRIIGAMTALHITLKALPLAYNKDMQEDKEPLFDATDHLLTCLKVLPRVIDGMRVDRAACRKAAQGGYSNATELADYLVEKGIPFREAHELAGKLVRRAIELRKPLEELPIAELRAVSPVIGEDVFARLSIDAAIAKRDVQGGTASSQVREAADRAAAHLH